MSREESNRHLGECSNRSDGVSCKLLHMWSTNLLWGFRPQLLLHATLCNMHCELRGERLSTNGYCYGCHLERNRARRNGDLEMRALARKRSKSEANRAKQRQRDSEPTARAAKQARRGPERRLRIGCGSGMTYAISS